jgi:1-hydroxy-2-isopentenylcarotenoid 3,4-desaturase
MSKKIVVIGAGIGGLGVASLLAKKGYSVTVIEKNESAGGRGRVWSKDGFRFDMGPSWYLMPDVFERYFSLFGKKVEDFYSLKRLDPNYRVFFDTNKVVDVPQNFEETCRLFDTFESQGGAKLRTFVDESKRRYESSMKDFVYRNYDSVLSVLQWRLIGEGMKLRVFDSLGSYVNKHFSSDEARKIVQYPIVFLGGDPQNTPALYSIMSHIDFNMGVWYPEGGIGNVFTSLVKLGESFGVRYLFGEEVLKVVSDGEGVRVETSNESYYANDVVMNGDYAHFETKMIEESDIAYSKSYWAKRTVAPSAFVAYLGLNKKVDRLRHHSLVFANDWEKHFRDIFEKPSWTDHPSYYVCCPSKTDSTVVPGEEYENLFVLVPLASGLDDSDEQREIYFEMILNNLEELSGESLKEHIVVKRLYSHRDFSADYHAYKGTALGLSHSLFQSAFWRPKMKHPRMNHVYYVGQYTHPGIGVPMGLISSEILVNTYFEGLS